MRSKIEITRKQNKASEKSRRIPSSKQVSKKMRLSNNNLLVYKYRAAIIQVKRTRKFAKDIKITLL